MKRLFYLFAALLLFGISCETTDVIPSGTVTFAEGTNFTAIFDPDGGSVTYNFTSDSSWVVKVYDEWVSVSPMSGTLHDTSFTIKVTDNDTFEIRESYVELVANNDKVYRIDIMQTNEERSFEVNGSDEYLVKASGGKVEIEVGTNISYEVEIPSSATSWLSLTNTRAIREEILTFEVAKNSTFDERKAAVKFKDDSGHVLRTVTFIQSGEEKVFDLKDSLNFLIGEDGGTKQVRLSTNLEYSIDIPVEAQEWLSVADTRATRDETLTFIIAPNENFEQRKASVKLNVEDFKTYTLTFTQQAKQLIFAIDKHSYLFDVGGGTCEITVETNVDYSIVVDAEAEEWLSYTTTRATQIDKVTISVLALTDTTYRSAELNFVATNGETLATFSAEQDASYKIFYTTTDGNPVDVYKTDGFGADYVSNIYYVKENIGILRFASPITTIPDQAFAICDNLATIDIPEGVTSIGERAFTGCTAMQQVTIPSTVTAVGAEAFVNCRGRAIINCNIDTDWSTYEKFSFQKAGFTEVVIGDKVETIGNHAFAHCYDLSQLTLGKRVKLIDEDAFLHNVALTSVVFPDSVETIKTWAFFGCSKLAVVTFGTGIKTLENPSFGGSVAGGTSELSLVYCKATTPPMASGTIFGIQSGLTIYVPKESGRDYKAAAAWCDYSGCIVLYDYLTNSIDDPDHQKLPRDKWLGVWDTTSSQRLVIDRDEVTIEDGGIDFTVSIVPHPSFDDEVLIYGLSANSFFARAYVDNSGTLNLVSGISVGDKDADGYEPTWLIYYKANGKYGFYSESLVSYKFILDGDSAVATPATYSIDGVKVNVLATEVYAVNHGTLSMGYYTEVFPVIYNAGELTLKRNTGISKSAVTPQYHINDVILERPVGRGIRR